MKIRIMHLALALVAVFLFSACSGEVNGVPEPHPASRSSVEAGRSLIASYGCGACHSIPGVAGANGSVGPPLDHFYERATIAGELPNTEENLIQWIRDPQQVVPGDAMPNLGVSASEARDIAAYLYHQLTLGELITH